MKVKNLKDSIFYVVSCIIILLISYIILPKTATLYAGLHPRLLLLLIVYPLMNIILGIICGKLKANIFILVAISLIMHSLLILILMNTSAFVYLIPFTVLMVVSYVFTRYNKVNFIKTRRE